MKDKRSESIENAKRVTAEQIGIMGGQGKPPEEIVKSSSSFMGMLVTAIVLGLAALIGYFAVGRA